MSDMNGTFVAYRPQWKDGEVWKNVEYKQLFGRGFHYPLIFGGICQEARLCGEAQAWAIAWTFAAEWEAVKPRSIEVRIVPYDVKYRIEYAPKPEPGGEGK